MWYLVRALRVLLRVRLRKLFEEVQRPCCLGPLPCQDRRWQAGLPLRHPRLLQLPVKRHQWRLWGLQLLPRLAALLTSFSSSSKKRRKRRMRLRLSWQERHQTIVEVSKLLL